MGINAPSNPGVNRSAGPRHSILDLAPLELECMSALWPLGEGTVRDIHHHLAQLRPRAYTTILTIMDRLAQKGIVTRRKVGRAYRYRPNLSADEARFSAVEKIIAGFFSGSADALAVHLAAQGGADRSTVRPFAPIARRPEAGRVAVQMEALGDSGDGAIAAPATAAQETQTRVLDESLL